MCNSVNCMNLAPAKFSAASISFPLLLLLLFMLLLLTKIQNGNNTAKADEDVMKDGASVGIELFEVFVLAGSCLCFHCFKINIVIDKTLQADILAAEPWQFSQLPQPDNFLYEN